MEATDAQATLTPPQEKPTSVNNIASLRKGENGKFVLSLKGTRSTREIDNISPDENAVLRLLVENRNKPELQPVTLKTLTEDVAKYLENYLTDPETFVKNNIRSLRDKLYPYWKITNINQKKGIKGAYILEEDPDQKESEPQSLEPKTNTATNSSFDTSLLLPIPPIENNNTPRGKAEINAATLILDLINRGLFNKNVPLNFLVARAFGDQDKLMERILGNDPNQKKVFLMIALKSNLDKFWVSERRSNNSIPPEQQRIVELCKSIRKKGHGKQFILNTLNQQLIK